MTAAVLFICFLFTLFLIRENFVPIAVKEMLSAREVFSSLQNPKLVLSLFVTSLIIGGHRFHCADPDALCTRSRGQRQ